jgi:hypothetical protein
VLRARAAIVTLDQLSDRFSGQPLRQYLSWQRGWLARAPLAPGVLRVVFVTRRGAVAATLETGRDAELARALGRFLSGGGPGGRLAWIDPGEPLAVQAAVAIAVEPLQLDRARHLHRHAWSAGGGPWLGLGDSMDGPMALELVTTCHLVVDGYAHVRIAERIFERVDEGTREQELLEYAAAAGLAPRVGVDGRAPAPHVSRLRLIGEPVGFAGESLSGTSFSFSRVAHAFGRALERLYRADLPIAARLAARRSPSFQFPVAPGLLDDPARRQHRILVGLLSLRMAGGEFESHDELRARLPSLIAREVAARGLLSRVLGATTRSRLPLAFRRWLLATSGRPHTFIPPIEVLGGRGRVSSLRFPPGERPAAPLFAVSSPGLSVSATDGRGSVLLTLVHHDDHHVTATVAGTGLCVTHEAARAFLELWRGEYRQLDDPAAPPACAPSTRPRRRRVVLGPP